MDAFAAALCRGAAARPGIGGALAVGGAFGAAQAAMPLIGWGLGVAFADAFRAVDHWVAFLLLSVIGGKMLRDGLGETEDDAPPAPQIGGWALLGAAVATSIDAAAAGVTLPMLGLPVMIACAVIGSITFLLSSAGVMMGAAAGAMVGRRATVAGGGALIAIGLKILIEHIFFGG